MLSELVGDDELCKQVPKLFEDNCKAPEQLVPDELLLMLSISSENVTVIEPEIEVKLSKSAGDVEETVGAVVSISNELIFSVTGFVALSESVIVQSL